MLTEAQTARIPEYRKKWIAIGLTTGKADRPRFEQGVRDCYKIAGLAPPPFEWVENPLEGALRANEVSSSPSAWANYRGGQFWVGGWWGSCAVVDFVTEVLGVTLPEPAREAARANRETAESGCWWWPFDELVICCERPKEIHRDAAGRLHSTTGYAIEWEGWGCCYVHGVLVPNNAILDPSSITADQINGERNAEVKRVLVELFGLQRYVRESKFELIDESLDAHGQPRRLLRGGEILVVELVNSTVDADGTRRVYHVPCHPQLRPLLPGGQLGPEQPLTALAAVASTYGMTAEEYQLTVET